jgi:hypothetical protein
MHNYDPELDPWWNWNHRGDIVISKSSNGVDWTHGVDLSAGDAWYNIDFAPTLIEFDNKLFALWETNGRHWGLDVENKFDWDLVYRYTTDGVTWSKHFELTPKNDTPEGENRAEFSFPDEDPRFIVYRDPVSNEERLYAIWRTRNPAITNGTDYDIVITYTTDGENWSAIEELTDPVYNGGYDNKPELTVYNNKLYVVWRREQGQRWENNPDGDIVTRHWDGNEWSVLQEISPPDGEGTGRDDFYANSVEFKNNFYTFWVTRNRGTGWTQGTDSDIVYRRMDPSDLPIDTGLDIGNDDAWELTIGTPLSDSNPSKTVNIKDAINQLMSNSDYLAENTWTDSYGNEMVTFMAKVYIGQPGRVRLDDLNIKYSSTLEAGDGITISPDLGEDPFRTKINDYIEGNPEKIVNGKIKIKLQVTSSVKGKARVHDVHIMYNLVPKLTLLTPTTGVNDVIIKKELTGQHTITWTDEDQDDNADLALYYYRTNSKKSKAKLIVSGLKEDDSKDSYIWEFSQEEVPSGMYYVFGVLSDGVDKAESIAPGILNVTWEKQYPPWIKITKPAKIEQAWNFYNIRWEDYDGNIEDNAKISLYYHQINFEDPLNFTIDNFIQIDLNEDGNYDDSDYIYEDDDGPYGEYQWNLTAMEPGNSFFIAAKIDDGFNEPVYNFSVGMVVKKYIVAPENLTLVDDINEDEAIWETHNLKPQLAWKLSEFATGTFDFHVTVWLGTSNAGTLIEEGDVSAQTTRTIQTELEYDKTYYAEVYAYTSTGARSEPISIVFSVVNNAPAAPTINIKPPTPAANRPLTCSVITTGLDIDGDPLTFKYKWYKNDEYQSKYDDMVNIESSATKKGEVWRVEVTPNDSFVDGTMASASVTIRNAVPSCEILEPQATWEIRDDTKITVKGKFDDFDEDSLVFVGWYLDLDNPDNLTDITGMSSIKKAEGDSAEDALEFKYKFKTGTHNLTLVVFDVDSLSADSPSSDTISIEVTKGSKDPTIKEDEFRMLVSGVIAAIVILVIILLLFIFLKRRKPVTEREAMYGKDLGLKPGEAYPVEESSDSYFGDALDRKGVDSLESD